VRELWFGEKNFHHKGSFGEKAFSPNGPILLIFGERRQAFFVKSYRELPRHHQSLNEQKQSFL